MAKYQYTVVVEGSSKAVKCFKAVEDLNNGLTGQHHSFISFKHGEVKVLHSSLKKIG